MAPQCVCLAVKQVFWVLEQKRWVWLVRAFILIFPGLFVKLCMSGMILSPEGLEISIFRTVESQIQIHAQNALLNDLVKSSALYGE